jgi:hypothetical protein
MDAFALSHNPDLGNMRTGEMFKKKPPPGQAIYNLNPFAIRL